jgi:hypothetical protein
MDLQSKLPKFRIAIITILLITSGLSCKFLSGSSPSTVPKDQNSPTTLPQEPTATPVTIPDGWKVSKDSTGACQVAAPADWVVGVDFFISVDKADPGPFEGAPAQYPPSGLALWGSDNTTQMPVGHYFQIRASRVDNGQVCSAWRIKSDVDFTDAEKSVMEQIGNTLRAVQ